VSWALLWIGSVLLKSNPNDQGFLSNKSFTVIKSTVQIPDSTLHIAHSTFHIPHSTFHISHSTFHIPDSWVLTFSNYNGKPNFSGPGSITVQSGSISGPGNICCTIWGSSAVRGSFAGGDHLRAYADLLKEVFPFYNRSCCPQWNFVHPSFWSTHYKRQVHGIYLAATYSGEEAKNFINVPQYSAILMLDNCIRSKSRDTH